MSDGITQSVTCDADGTLRVRLTIPPGVAPPTVSPYGGTLQFPEPIQVAESTTAVVEMEWLPYPAREETAQPMRIPAQTTLTHLYLGPSAAKPGTTQLAVSEGEPNVLPDLFWSRIH